MHTFWTFIRASIQPYCLRKMFVQVWPLAHPHLSVLQGSTKGTSRKLFLGEENFKKTRGIQRTSFSPSSAPQASSSAPLKMSTVSQSRLQVWHSCHALNHSGTHTLEVWASYALDNRLLRVKLVSQPQLTLQTHLWQKPRTEPRATKDTVMTHSSFLWLFLYFFPGIWSICLHVLMPFSRFPPTSTFVSAFCPWCFY